MNHVDVVQHQSKGHHDGLRTAGTDNKYTTRPFNPNIYEYRPIYEISFFCAH